MAGIDDMGFFASPAYIDSEEFARGAGLPAELMSRGLGVRRKSVASRYVDNVALGLAASEQVLRRLPDGKRKGLRRTGASTETWEKSSDHSKPMSSFMLPLFNGIPDRIVEDERTYNVSNFQAEHACLAGLNLLELYLGREALLVASDVAHYDLKNDPSAEGTAGNGAAAVLTGEGRMLRVPDEVVLEDLYGFSSSHTYDFTKPCDEDGCEVRSRKFPKVDGKFSFLSYLKNVGEAYRNLKERWDGGGLDSYRGIVMHVPYPKMPQYALKYLRMIDEGRDGEVRDLIYSVRSFDEKSEEVYKETKELLKDFSGQGQYRDLCERDARKLEPSLVYPADVGNCYTASVFLSLASWLENADYGPGDRVLVLGYGSGGGSIGIPMVVTGETKERVAHMGVGEQIYGPQNKQLDFEGFLDYRNGGGEPPAGGWMFEGRDADGKCCYTRVC